jgi:hypothetical protein
MFCLALAYVAVVVFVTVGHSLPTKEAAQDTKFGADKSGGDTDKDEGDPKKKTFKDTLIKAKDKQAAKKYVNPVRKHHLDLELGAGVEPVKLDLDKGDSIVAVTEDPPANEHPTPNSILTAYLEPLNYDDLKIQPLPVRQTAKADLLKPVQYSRLSSCSKLTMQWPTDDPPTDQDPFLPWIHDVFPTADGKYIQFVAQNKRRCKTGSKEKDILAHMAPQAALFQHVSVRRVSDEGDTRYRLASHEQADPDGVATRFICRFKPSMEETLSEYNFDYDWTSYRKRYKVSFAEDEGGIKQIHTTQLIFRCPVPASLQDTVRTGSSVKDDWASLFVDLIPIRTATRWGLPTQYLVPRYSEFQEQDPEKSFDPVKAWGEEHILPRIEDAGRWENIPICKPSLMTYESDDAAPALPAPADEKPPKEHRLVSCLWASSGYTTRGNRFAVNDGQRRLLEWIQYNTLIGFDHFYVYDNSGAFGPDSSLKAIADLFPDKVTYIPWPATICNNNPNNVDSVGERSSQYAAEASCRLRFGPHVGWIGQFDIDEYLVPMGDHNNITSLLDELEAEDTKIISFGSWRAWPRWKYIEEPEPIDDPEVCWSKEPCFQLQIPLNHTMLQAYNCDRQKPGQKTSSMPAEKQLYTADYVLQHFVHYSAVTVLSEKNRTEYEKEGFTWKRRGFPDPRQRFGNEVKEGLMIHTKAVARQDTAGWERVCSIQNAQLSKRLRGLCRLGVPWPEDPEEAKRNATKDGKAYNCFVNQKVEKYFVPRLDAELKQFEHIFDIDKQ